MIPLILQDGIKDLGCRRARSVTSPSGITRGNESLTGQCIGERMYQVGFHVRLDDVSTRAHGQGCRQVLLILLDGEKDYAAREPLPSEFPRSAKPVEPRHANVEDDKLRVKLFYRVQRQVTIFYSGNHLKFFSEHCYHCMQGLWMIVGKHYSRT